jgi:PAT family beta-lactamase induction signal transducer AmpG
MKSLKNINPWLWVPTLYFLEGIPYFLVNNLSMAMFTNLGVPNGEMSFFTTLLYFPWALKFLWAPFVDLIKTKRWWFLTMQFLMLGLAVLTIFSIPHPDPTTIAAMSTDVTLFTGVLIAFIIMAFASATHDIAADGFYMLALKPGVQAEMIGWRSVFYRLSNVFCNSALIAIPGFIFDWTKEQGNQSMPFAWQVTIGIIAVIFIIMAIWHMFFTPRPATDQPNEDTNIKKIIADFGQAFSTFFKKPALWVAILFMLLYRLPEGFLLKMLYPFLFATREMGGLGMSNQEFGLVYGTFGVIFLLIGGILGGAFISRVGLKKAFWWMAIGMTLPCLSFVYLSEFMPTNMVNIAVAIAIEQFGYGFGFTAYMMYMMYFSDGEFKTSHYAICTSFMALSMILPGLVAGYIQEAIGYENFFWMVISCSVATFFVTFLARRIVDANYGKK